MIARTSPADPPTLVAKIVNFVMFQAAWFAAVLGAAHLKPLWGTGAVLAVIAVHLAMSARPLEEAKLVGIVCVVGFVAETIVVLQGYVTYPSGQPVHNLPPYWMVALWGLLAIALNVTMRWLKTRLWLAAILGAMAGPASFVSGVQLGGASFVQANPALITSAIGWALLMPLLVALSNRFDGVGRPRSASAQAANATARTPGT